MKEIVWVFGIGAIGKKTQMLQAANMQRKSLIRMILKVPRERVLLPVIIAGGHSDRNGLIRQIHESSIDALFLIHGQDQDHGSGALKEFCSPKSERCLYVWTSEGEFLRRCQERKKKISHQDYKVALNHRDKWLNQILPNHFQEIIKIET